MKYPLALLALVFVADSALAQCWNDATLALPAGSNSALFGTRVAIDGDTMVLASREITPLDPDRTGEVFVFERLPAGGWSQVARLTPTTSQPRLHQFGSSVAIDGDTIAIGAKNVEPSVSGNPWMGPGSLFVFERDAGGPGNWGQVIERQASAAAVGDRFGVALALEGDTIVVGAPTTFPHTGSAFVFERDLGGAGNWGESRVLAAPNGFAGDFFGARVAIGDDRILVNQRNVAHPGGATGSALLFERDAGGIGAWGPVAELVPAASESQGQFAFSVALEGDLAICGLFQSNPGKVYIHARDQGGPNAWGVQRVIDGADASFGMNSAIRADRLLIGAPLDSTFGHEAGSIHEFARHAGGTNNWGAIGIHYSPTAAPNEAFGNPLAFDGRTFVTRASDVPHAISRCQVLVYCAAGANSVSAGGAHAEASGSTSLTANELRLTATPVPNGQPGLFYYGASTASVPFGDGTRCIGGFVRRLGVEVSANDALTHEPDTSGSNMAPILAGSTWFFQAWYRDPAFGGSGFNLSDGLELSFVD